MQLSGPVIHPANRGRHRRYRVHPPECRFCPIVLCFHPMFSGLWYLLPLPSPGNPIHTWSTISAAYCRATKWRFHDLQMQSPWIPLLWAGSACFLLQKGNLHHVLCMAATLASSASSASYASYAWKSMNFQLFAMIWCSTIESCPWAEQTSHSIVLDRMDQNKRMLLIGTQHFMLHTVVVPLPYREAWRGVIALVPIETLCPFSFVKGE